MRILKFVLAFLAALMLIFPATAQMPAAADLRGEQAHFWRDATRVDVEAAYELVRNNHPAMVPEVGDPAFRDTLEAAHALARTRAAGVTTFEGYAATLAGLADALGDQHIFSRPDFTESRPDWAGILVSKRGARWVVADEDEANTSNLTGATLISCDGRLPEDMARDGIGQFRVDWSVGAQQVHAAPWLLIDDHNPFIRRPQACIFDKGGQRTVTLQWRPIRIGLLEPRIDRAVGIGAAGFGVRKVGAGYWIGLQSLLDSAAPVVVEVEAQADAMRRAAFVVLDLRGNTGGSSVFGHQIAETLLGAPYVDARIDASDNACGDDVWRASDGNIHQLQVYLDTMSATHGPEFVRIVSKVLAEAKAARAAGRPMSGPLTCASHKPDRQTAQPTSTLKGRLILLTDSACFSACLAVTDEFRTLGALHIGQTTNANTHYTENRVELLPSGLSRFSTLQAMSPGNPLRFGNFVPERAYDGDITDTAGLEKWVGNMMR